MSLISYTGGLFTTRARKGQFFPFVFVLLAASSTTTRNDVVISHEIPESVIELAMTKRNELIEQLAEVDEEIGELFLNDELPSNDQIAAAIRHSTIALMFSPVFLGSAIKNTAVQPMLDGVCAYLPNPAESEVLAHDTSLPYSAPQIQLPPTADAPWLFLRSSWRRAGSAS